jgi:hypothetical protein
MDAIVQLVRNALSCVKDLQLFEGTFIHDASYTREFLSSLPDPLDLTTPLEAVISLTQLYACLSCTKSGFALMTKSIGKLRRILRLVQHRMTNKHAWTDADRIVNESLLKEAKFALRFTFIGFLVFPTGVCFWWLFLNSWHITSVDWFGGLPALIHALTIMEICLFPLCYLMVVDGLEMFQKSKKTKANLESLQQGKLEASKIGIATYETMTGWVPFWDAGVPMFSGPGKNEAKQVEQELEKVNKTLATWFVASSDKKGEKEGKLQKVALQEAEDKLEAAVPVLRMEGYRELFYFVLNFIAFYGYLMGVMVYYHEDDAVQPYHVRSLKFGYENEHADWHGNFAGDLMWTIEPIVVLSSPFLVAYMIPPKRKVKAD